MGILELFPGLRQTHWAVMSPQTPEYNCIAWAAGDPTRWWWPDAAGDYYWPPGVPREETVEAFIAAFARLGYELREAGDRALEPGYEKVAIYAKDDKPTHVARQLQTGAWTSKCGRLEDIGHALEGLEGCRYGSPAAVMRRRQMGAPVATRSARKPTR
jgi:hypothetical protein